MQIIKITDLDLSISFIICMCSTMASISAFQAEDTGSIPVTCLVTKDWQMSSQWINNGKDIKNEPHKVTLSHFNL